MRIRTTSRRTRTSSSKKGRLIDLVGSDQQRKRARDEETGGGRDLEGRERERKGVSASPAQDHFFFFAIPKILQHNDQDAWESGHQRRRPPRFTPSFQAIVNTHHCQ